MWDPRQVPGLPNRTYITSLTVVPATHEAALALAKESLRLMRGFSEDTTLAAVAGQPCYLTAVTSENEYYYPSASEEREREVAEKIEGTETFRVTREQYNNMVSFFEKYFVEPEKIPTTYTPLDHDAAVGLIQSTRRNGLTDTLIRDLHDAGYELCRRDPK